MIIDYTFSKTMETELTIKTVENDYTAQKTKMQSYSTMIWFHSIQALNLIWSIIKGYR